MGTHPQTPSHTLYTCTELWRTGKCQQTETLIFKWTYQNFKDCNSLTPGMTGQNLEALFIRHYFQILDWRIDYWSLGVILYILLLWLQTTASITPGIKTYTKKGCSRYKFSKLRPGWCHSPNTRSPTTPLQECQESLGQQNKELGSHRWVHWNKNIPNSKSMWFFLIPLSYDPYKQEEKGCLARRQMSKQSQTSVWGWDMYYFV